MQLNYLPQPGCANCRRNVNIQAVFSITAERDVDHSELVRRTEIPARLVLSRYGINFALEKSASLDFHAAPELRRRTSDPPSLQLTNIALRCPRAARSRSIRQSAWDGFRIVQYRPYLPRTLSSSFFESNPTPSLKTISTFSMSEICFDGSPLITTKSAFFPAEIDPI